MYYLCSVTVRVYKLPIQVDTKIIVLRAYCTTVNETERNLVFFMLHCPDRILSVRPITGDYDVNVKITGGRGVVSLAVIGLTDGQDP